MIVRQGEADPFLNALLWEIGRAAVAGDATPHHWIAWARQVVRERTSRDAARTPFADEAHRQAYAAGIVGWPYRDAAQGHLGEDRQTRTPESKAGQGDVSSSPESAPTSEPAPASWPSEAAVAAACDAMRGDWSPSGVVRAAYAVDRPLMRREAVLAFAREFGDYLFDNGVRYLWDFPLSYAERFLQQEET